MKNVFLKYLDLKVKPLSVTGSVEKPGSRYRYLFSEGGSETLALLTVLFSIVTEIVYGTVPTVHFEKLKSLKVRKEILKSFCGDCLSMSCEYGK